MNANVPPEIEAELRLLGASVTEFWGECLIQATSEPRRRFIIAREDGMSCAPNGRYVLRVGYRTINVFLTFRDALRAVVDMIARGVW